MHKLGVKRLKIKLANKWKLQIINSVQGHSNQSDWRNQEWE